MSKEEFKEFNYKLLKGILNQKSLDKYLNDDGLAILRLAFVHKSYDSENNYETYEILGDSILTNCIVRYLIRRFPKIVSVKWLTKLKHNLISKKTFSMLSRNWGFDKFLLYGQELKDEIEQDRQEGIDKTFNSLLEDCFEAYLGALSIVIDNYEQTIGVSSAVSYKITEQFLNSMTIDTSYEALFDPKTRLKEIFDKYGWGQINSLTTFSKDPVTKNVTWHIYGYPLGNKTALPENKVLLVKIIGKGKDETFAQGADQAIKVLSEKYNISEFPSDPQDLN